LGILVGLPARGLGAIGEGVGIEATIGEGSLGQVTGLTVGPLPGRLLLLLGVPVVVVLVGLSHVAPPTTIY